MNLTNKFMFMLLWIIHSFSKKYVRIFSENYFFFIVGDLLGKACQITSMIPSLLKKSNDVQNSWKPVVIIIPLRLGLNDVNSEYIEQLKVRKEKNPSSSIDCLLLVMLSFTSNSWIHWRKTKSSALFHWLSRKR